MYKLIPYYPVIASGDTFFIGIAGSEKYVEATLNDDEITDLEHLIKFGVDENIVETNSLLSLLKNADMLYRSDQCDYSTNRNNLFFQYLTQKDISSTVLKTPILIMGAGAGGSTLAYSLAQFGYTNIAISDADIVEKTDVDKSFVFDLNDIGKYKVDCIAEKISNSLGINIRKTNMMMNSREDIVEIIINMNPQFIVKACDPDHNFRLHLSNVCYERGIPFIHMSYFMEYINIGPLFVPQVSYCDYIINETTINKFGEKYSFKRLKKLYKEHLIHPSVSFNVNILSSLILKEMTFYLSNNHNFNQTIGSIVYLNTITLQHLVTKIKISSPVECPFPECRTCKAIRQ